MKNNCCLLHSHELCRLLLNRSFLQGSSRWPLRRDIFCKHWLQSRIGAKKKKTRPLEGQLNGIDNEKNIFGALEKSGHFLSFQHTSSGRGLNLSWTSLNCWSASWRQLATCPKLQSLSSLSDFPCCGEIVNVRNFFITNSLSLTFQLQARVVICFTLTLVQIIRWCFCTASQNYPVLIALRLQSNLL